VERPLSQKDTHCSSARWSRRYKWSRRLKRFFFPVGAATKCNSISLRPDRRRGNGSGSGSWIDHGAGIRYFRRRLHRWRRGRGNRLRHGRLRRGRTGWRRGPSGHFLRRIARRQVDRPKGIVSTRAHATIIYHRNLLAFFRLQKGTAPGARAPSNHAAARWLTPPSAS